MDGGVEIPVDGDGLGRATVGGVEFQTGGGLSPPPPRGLRTGENGGWLGTSSPGWRARGNPPHIAPTSDRSAANSTTRPQL